MGRRLRLRFGAVILALAALAISTWGIGRNVAGLTSRQADLGDATLAVTLLLLAFVWLWVIRPLARQLERDRASVQVLEAVAAAANASTCAREPIRVALREVCEKLGWTAGHALAVPNDRPGCLVSTGILHPRRRGERADRAHRPVGAPGGLPPGRAMAALGR